MPSTPLPPASGAASAPPPAPTTRLAVVGAGPVGLALALLAARQWPQAQITVFDARDAGHDVSADPRTLALSLGSVQLLQRLGAWPGELAQAITEVHVSQAPPTFAGALGGALLKPEVRLSALGEGVPMLGAVLAYGQLVAPLQRAWQAACAAEPRRCTMRFGSRVAALKAVPQGVEIDAGIAECFDLAVIAEGGVFADAALRDKPQPALHHDYQQTAWVGTVVLADPAVSASAAVPGAQRAAVDGATAFERFTRHGPVALLPLASRNGLAPGQRRAALVWCVPSGDDPVQALTPSQRRAVLATLLPDAAGRLVEVGPLKHFPLGLSAERTLVSGRQVRIGNAAQTLHPVAGQGLNLGLRDAFSLVQTLRAATDIDAALKRVEWSRAADRWSMIAATDFLARSFTWQLPGLAAARGLGLAALQALPPLKSALARRMMFGQR